MSNNGMPSIATQYTPFESFLFIHWIGGHGTESSAFLSASESLRTNHFVQTDKKYNRARLAPENLKILYDELNHARESDLSPLINGNNFEHKDDPRKRESSAARHHLNGSIDNEHYLARLVDELYIRYREDAVQEIKQQERQYQTLISELRQIEEGASVAHHEVFVEPIAPDTSSSGDTSAAQTNQVSSSIEAEPEMPVEPESGPTVMADATTSNEAARSTGDKPPVSQSQNHSSFLAPDAEGADVPQPDPPNPPDPPDHQVLPLNTAHPNTVSTQQAVNPNKLLPSPVRPGQYHYPPPENTSPRPNALPSISSLMRRSPPSPPPAPPPPPQSSHASSKKESMTPRSPPVLPSLSSQYPPQAPYGYQYSQWSPYPSQGYQVPGYPRNLPPSQSPVYYHYPPYPYSPPPNSYGSASFSPATHPLPPRPPSDSSQPHFAPPPSTIPANASVAAPAGASAAATSTPTPSSSLPLPPQHLPPRAVQQAELLSSGPTISTPDNVASKGENRSARPGASATLTPWTPGDNRQDSPERPCARDVSPLSEESSSPARPTALRTSKPAMLDRQRSPRENSPKKDVGDAQRGIRHSRRAGTPRSTVPQTQGRLRSPLSPTSLNRIDEHSVFIQGSDVIKAEAPSTPVPDTSHVEAASPSWSDRPRAAQSRTLKNEQTGRKRKRESDLDPPASPSLPSPSSHDSGGPATTTPGNSDPSMVLVSKNFSRMAATILNDVNSHKVAGIFARPLTERDAPGYGDLIYRPQDLKSIRAAVARGSRAANVAIDELEAGKADEGASHAAEGSMPQSRHLIPAGSELVKKTEELCPPKAIVNSAQLEMELMRMFANAVMFNPLPLSERNLPPTTGVQAGQLKHSGVRSPSSSRPPTDIAYQEKPANRTRRGGRRTSKEGITEKDKKERDAVKGRNAAAPSLNVIEDDDEEEGGIIVQDTREMFDSVEKAVAQWRGLEQGWHADDTPRAGSGVALRGGGGGSSSVIDTPVGTKTAAAIIPPASGTVIPEDSPLEEPPSEATNTGASSSTVMMMTTRGRKRRRMTATTD